MHKKLPLFIAAGNPRRWESHAWRPFFTKLGKIIARNWPHELKKAADEAASLPVHNDYKKKCRQWWTLALRYSLIYKEYLLFNIYRRTMNETEKYVGRDPEIWKRHFVDPIKKLTDEIAIWTTDLKLFWNRN